jgi:hypothetical protein
MSSRNLLAILFSIALVSSAYADKCRRSIVLLGGESDRNPQAQRSEMMGQMSRLYSEALNNRVSMEIVLGKLQAFAEIDGTGVESLLKELESMESSPSERKAMAEALQAQRTQERSQFYEGLQPYLDRIGQAHREVIERELIASGRVNPLSTGEVEFYFEGEHPFVIGDEFFRLGDAERTQTVSFLPGDGFAIGQVPVTQFLYFLAALDADGVDPTPSEFRRGEGSVTLRLGDKKYQFKPNHPVEMVSYDDAAAHARRVSKVMGVPYALPTGKQWEFANRSGGDGAYHFGNDETLLPYYAWFSDNSGEETHAVGELLPNDFHLFDTHGNVQEWIATADQKVATYRGGSWEDVEGELRSKVVHYRERSSAHEVRGFRLVRSNPGKVHPIYTFTFGTSEPEVKDAHTGSGVQK